jgi:uncharacterized Zn finger protein
MVWKNEYPPYVSVAERRKKGEQKIQALKAQGYTAAPVIIEGRAIAKTIWAKTWCQHLESYSDYASRLPRGRTYARNGSIIDLRVSASEMKAIVSGSALYDVHISVKALPLKQWQAIVDACTGKIDSMIELLQGKFSASVMAIISAADKGLLPKPQEIKFACSCPDGAYMCKHIAAVLYGFGARLDNCPESLFLLRGVEPCDLLAQVDVTTMLNDQGSAFSQDDLSSLFGIDIAPEAHEKN